MSGASRWATAIAPVLDTVYAEGFGTISPDGKWLAYQSDQSGRNEVYVQAFDGLRTAPSAAGWSPRAGPSALGFDSGELFYMTTDGRMMPSRFAWRPTAVWTSQPQLLFQTRPVPQDLEPLRRRSDGQRFLVNFRSNGPARRRLRCHQLDRKHQGK